jgi:hypothetical protein
MTFRDGAQPNAAHAGSRGEWRCHLELDHLLQNTDIQWSAELLSTRGVQFESQPRLIARMPDHQLWMAFFRDTEGNLAALMSEVR